MLTDHHRRHSLDCRSTAVEPLSLLLLPSLHISWSTPSLSSSRTLCALTLPLLHRPPLPTTTTDISALATTRSPFQDNHGSLSPLLPRSNTSLFPFQQSGVEMFSLFSSNDGKPNLGLGFLDASEKPLPPLPPCIEVPFSTVISLSLSLSPPKFFEIRLVID
ncbi:hypothetical protein RJ641_015089 [Dillenia turbinata]|uniref:Uncharacterized protein n=1 Tax=Dillenia turbinata TaxID=194707 RepID=A0AAN8V0G1_9MAGN